MTPYWPTELEDLVSKVRCYLALVAWLAGTALGVQLGRAVEHERRRREHSPADPEDGKVAS